MKKFLFIIIFILNINTVYASTKTYNRTIDNLKVPDNIEVTDNNINAILDTKAVNEKEKIYDYANILTETQEEKVYKKITKFIKESNIDIVIITEKEKLPDPANYAFNFYDYNYFKPNGLIFLINLVDNKTNIYMWTSGNVTKTYNSKRIEAILKYEYDLFLNKKYYKGIDNFVKVVHSYYIADKEGTLVRMNKKGNVIKTIPWFDIFILSVALTFILSFFLNKKVSVNRVDYQRYLVKQDITLESEELIKE